MSLYVKLLAVASPGVLEYPPSMERGIHTPFLRLIHLRMPQTDF